ncbi:flagellin [Notoacmeibacter sp. MSK16QG-6]|uniref:flagellin N-terminal helical domain-containing protein n=1 Tax=Notoacmeibacter sp. MSK16QG-6 TaxID=2957982 RepID=UPI0020A07342|nr:flagellin [Notoacmeibacter sp. MSK16QG-6]MCP1200927.1 flagellin [Notoacmeibacter sp. MSK16QG-6]
MTSLMTNTSAMTALKSLQATNNALEATQKNISTGYRVSDASDNAAYWSIATTMRSDSKALGTVTDALGLGAAKLDVAYTGMNSAIDVVQEMKSKIVAAQEPGVDKSKVQSEIGALQEQLLSIADSASFSGENWLTSGGTKSLVASFTRDSTGAVSVTSIDLDLSGVQLVDSTATPTAGILGAAGTASSTSVLAMDVTSGNLDDLLTDIDTALESMTTAAADIGSAKNRVSIQSDFVNELRDSIARGVGKLVDADMTEESTKLQALQTQQQLGIQALSMANSGSQSLLALFR